MPKATIQDPMHIIYFKNADDCRKACKLLGLDSRRVQNNRHGWGSTMDPKDPTGQARITYYSRLKIRDSKYEEASEEAKDEVGRLLVDDETYWSD